MRWRISIRSDIAASIASQYLGDPNAPLQFPTVNRKTKRNSLLARPREPLPPLPPLLAIEPVPPAQADAPLTEGEAGGRIDPYSDYEFAIVPAEQPATPDGQNGRRGKSGGSQGRFPRLFRRRSAGRGRSADQAVGRGRGADRARLRRSRHQAVGARTAVAGRRQGRRNHRQQGRSHRRRPASEIAGRAARRSPVPRAPRPRNASPTRSISRRAAKRCAGRSRSRKWY